MKKQLKHLRFPSRLIAKISKADVAPSYVDFTTKVFLILERGLKGHYHIGEVEEQKMEQAIKSLVQEMKLLRTEMSELKKELGTGTHG